MGHPSRADILPPAIEDEHIMNNKVQPSSESSSSSSESDEDYEEDDQTENTKAADDSDDSADSDGSDDESGDYEYDEGNNEIEIDDRTKGKHKGGELTEEIDGLKNRIHKRELRPHAISKFESYANFNLSIKTTFQLKKTSSTPKMKRKWCSLNIAI